MFHEFLEFWVLLIAYKLCVELVALGSCLLLSLRVAFLDGLICFCFFFVNDLIVYIAGLLLAVF